MLLISHSPLPSTPRSFLRDPHISTSLSSSFLQTTTSRFPDLRRRSRTRNNQTGGNRKVCHAELVLDAPFVAAIGACIFNSLLFPVYPERDVDGDGDGDEVIDSTDMRLAVMGVISFIPYFDWMSWLFAWLDSGKQRYLVYSIVYLAPYFRTNLSLSPEESWVPIASIILCIIHVQLEISIMNGDIRGILSRSKQDKPSRDHQRMQSEEKRKDRGKLPSSQDESRDRIRGWKAPRTSADILRQLKKHDDADEEKKQSD